MIRARALQCATCGDMPGLLSLGVSHAGLSGLVRLPNGNHLCVECVRDAVAAVAIENRRLLSVRVEAGAPEADAPEESDDLA